MDIVIAIVILIFSAVLHEIMHGFVAYRLGDPTAKLLGRLTFNPLPHIDPIMSVLLPAALYFMSGGQVIFAAAKPVPVNPMHLHDPRRDMALVALAGPITNFLIAAVAAILFRLSGDVFLAYIFLTITQINLFLGFLNLIPIPPLDGSKVFTILLPDHIAETYLSIERYGIFILFFLLTFPIGPFSLGAFLSHLVFQSMRLLGI